MMRVLLLIFATVFVFAPVVAGQMYKWIDPQGNVSYRDHPPPEGSGYRVEEKSVSDDAYISPGAPTVTGLEKKPVKLYTVKKCDACDLVRVYLQKRKIPFTEKDVEKSVKNQKELKKHAGSVTVPVTVVGDKIVIGYNQSSLEKELADGGYPKKATTN